jgi:GNAT superfamily N-acetyltransferase
MTADPTLCCTELTPKDWPALEKLFGPNGACGGCWCMWWRVERGGKAWRDIRGSPAKRTFKRLVTKQQARGILAFWDERAVGWCAYGPRSDFPKIERARAFQRADNDGVWSVNCFYILRDFRGKGVARALLRASIDSCRRAGARVVEGYPVTTTQDGRRVASSFAYTGPLKIFEEQGFELIQRISPTRPLVRLQLSS